MNLEHQIPHLKNNIAIDDRTSFTIGRRYLNAKRVGYRYIIVINQKSFENVPLFEFNDTHKMYKEYLTEAQLSDYIRKNTIFHEYESL